MTTDLVKEKKFLVESPEFPYCMGCGHTMINKALDSAFHKLGKAPTQINLVSDIGCVGLVDKLFLTNTIHTTHGRSSAFACGLQLADEILYRDDTTHVVMIGDGGATIGLLHLVEAAKLNANITVILHNNFVYGMTGGQNSGLTPENFKTSTTMAGNIVAPVHIANLLEAAHASFIARKLATDRDLDETLLKAMQHDGFALVEVIELCTGYATKWNKMARSDVEDILNNMDCGELGIIREDSNNQTYAKNYSRIFPAKFDEITAAQRKLEHKKIQIKQQAKFDKAASLVIAGSAGEGVQFASKTLIETAVRDGLNVVQKNDNPVTIGTGFSLTEINFSAEEIFYSGIEVPDYILIGSTDGLNRAKEFINRSTEDTLILVDESLKEEFNKHVMEQKVQAKSIIYPFRAEAKNPRVVNFMMIGCLLKSFTGLNIESLKSVILDTGKKSEPILEAIDKGFKI